MRMEHRIRAAAFLAAGFTLCAMGALGGCMTADQKGGGTDAETNFDPFPHP